MPLKGHVNNDKELAIGLSNVANIGDFDSFHEVMGAQGESSAGAMNASRVDRG